MCGFVGYVNNKKKNKKVIKDMSKKIIHRGPDSEGYFMDDKIHMAFRRLKIIDLNSGNQPMYNETESLVIMFNGEIYNYLELREELKKKGHIFQSNSDTEVLLHGYEEYKEDILNKIRGMYAFVIYNRETKELFMARDIFGIKPFYYAMMNDTFFFGSEIKAFLENPDFQKELNEEALKTFLVFQYNPNKETFFKNVYKLEPGHYMIYKDGELETHQYYTIMFHPKRGNEKKLIKDLHETIHESVEYHKRSDVELGSFLSAGVDSSYLTSILRPDKTFSVGFSYKGFDETSAAKDLCAILNLKNISRTISKQEFLENVEKVQYYSDEPHANLSSVPLYSLCKLARENVVVVLSGEGADELFAGYSTYYEHPLQKIYEYLPFSVRKLNKKLAGKLPNNRLKSMLIKGGTSVEESYIGQAKIFEEQEANCILKEKYQNDILVSDITKPYFDQVKHLDNISKKQYLDMFLWLPNDILLKADKMSMAHSIELRVPYLDKKVLEFAFHVPKKLKYKGQTSKYLLREAAKEAIPKSWYNREKLGFMVPFKDFLKESDCYKMVKKEFSSEYAKEFFETDKILALLEDHFKGKALNQRKIYAIYSFLVWYRIYFIEN